MRRLIFKGMMAATFTPFNEDGSLNLTILPQYVDHLLKSGVAGIFVNGTTGEGMSLTVNERKTLAESWLRACEGHPIDIVVMIGAGCLKDTQELARHAANLGVAGIATLPCLYDKPETIEDLVDYCSDVAEMAPKTPLLYYHIPFKTDVNLPMDEFLTEGGKKIETLSGIKFTSRDVSDEGFRSLKLHDGKYTIFSGIDECLYQSLLLGYKCAINCGFNFLADEAKMIFEIVDKNLLTNTDDESWKREAEKHQKMIDDTLALIFSYTGGFKVSAAKAAMKIMTGIDVGSVRKPLRPLKEETIRDMEKRLKTLWNIK